MGCEGPTEPLTQTELHFHVKMRVGGGVGIFFCFCFLHCFPLSGGTGLGQDAQRCWNYRSGSWEGSCASVLYWVLYVGPTPFLCKVQIILLLLLLFALKSHVCSVLVWLLSLCGGWVGWEQILIHAFELFFLFVGSRHGEGPEKEVVTEVSVIFGA